jgi:hypothetical protein
MINYSVLSSSQDHLKMTTLYLASVEKTDSWYTKKGDLQCAYPLDVPMVPTSAIVVTVDGERLACGGFSLGETIHLGNFEFIADYFNSLSLSLGRQ